MEPLDTSDLINNLNTLGCLTPLSMTNSPVSGIRAPVTIISNMASSGSSMKAETINPRGLLDSLLQEDISEFGGDQDVRH